MLVRERTPILVIVYAVYLVFEGLSLRACSRTILPFTRRSHKSVWMWMQELAPLDGLLFNTRRRRTRLFLIDETEVQVGRSEAWIWVCYEPFQKRFLGMWFSWTRSSLAAELFLKEMVRKYGKHPVWSDGATCYPEACRSLGLKHQVYAQGEWLYEVMERAVQTVKDRTESFDDYFPCSNPECRQKHIWNWIRLFHLHKQPEYLQAINTVKEVITLR